MPKQKQNTMIFAELRKQEIVRLVQEKGKITVARLCEVFSVSPATIRNDLTELDKAGLIQRTHGGAISTQLKANFELKSSEREIRNALEKQMIAKEALKYIHEGDAIIMDNGTTTFELAKLLVCFSKLTVVTNDIKIAAFLEANTDFDIILLGGMIRKDFSCTVGKSAISMLENVYSDVVFMAANGVDFNRGISTPGVDVAEVKRKMIKCSEKVILLADSSKFNRSYFAIFAEPSDITLMITDENVSDATLKDAKKCELDIVIASQN